MQHYSIFNSEKKLLKKIRERIAWDKRISNADVEVKIAKGHAILSGIVDSPFRKKAILDVVGTTVGVFSVEDQIMVPPDFYRTDQELRSVITEQISKLPLRRGEVVTVDVADGMVKLDGRVFDPKLKGSAAGIVWELSGVKDCLNCIEISEPPIPAIHPRKEVLGEILSA